MAKRGAGDQLTKDDYDERGGDDEDVGLFIYHILSMLTLV